MSAAMYQPEPAVRHNFLSGWVANRSVSTKNLIAVLLIAVVAMAVAGYSISRMSMLNRELTGVKAEHVDSLVHLVTVRQGLGTVYNGQWVYALGSPANKTDGRAQVAQGDAMIDTALADYGTAAADSPSRTAAVASLRESLDYYRGLRNVAYFREAPPAGFTLPAADQIAPQWTATDQKVADAIMQLQSLENDEADAVAKAATHTYQQSRMLTILVLAIGLAIALAFALWVSRVMRRQLRTVSAALSAVADGNLTRQAGVYGRDELGHMAGAVNRACAGIRGTVETLTVGAQTLGSSSDRLTGMVGRIAESAKQAATQADGVSVDAGDVSRNVQAVAAGAEEMGSSIREIAQNANSAAQVASEAVGVAETTNRTVSKLGDSSIEIGNVVKVITSIAEQTNLLALNATIEAARAGDAGKGFAVVASEVKDLAQETARATEDISQRVQAIQSDATNAVAAIGEISRIIGRINDYQLTIASAVEEQTATTGEMSRSVNDAAQGAANIAGNISGVASSARTTTSNLVEADDTVTELSRLAKELQGAVARFTV